MYDGKTDYYWELQTTVSDFLIIIYYLGIIPVEIDWPGDEIDDFISSIGVG